MKTEIDKLATSFPNTTPVLLDIGRNMEELEKLVKGHDLVIRLVHIRQLPQFMSVIYYFHILNSAEQF